MKLTIEKRVFLSFLVIAILVILITYTGSNFLIGFQGSIDNIVNKQEPILTNIIKARADLLTSRQELYEYTDTGDEKNFQNFELARSNVGNHLITIGKNDFEGQELRMWIDIKGYYNSYNELTEILAEIYEKDPEDRKKIEEKKSEISNLLESMLLTELHLLYDQNQMKISEFIKNSQGSYSRSMWVVIILGGLVIFIGIVNYFSISNAMIKPIKKLNMTLNNITTGSLNEELDPELLKINNEVGSLARGFHRTIISLKLAMKERAPELKKESEALKQLIAEKDKSEEKIKESQKELETVINSSPDLIFLKDDKLRYVVANKAHENIFNIKVKDMIGKTDHDFMLKKSADRCKKTDMIALKDGEAYAEEFLNGRWFQVIKKQVLDDDGVVMGVTAVIRDVTVLKSLIENLEDAEERLRVLFDYVPDGYYLIDMKGNFIDGNKTAEKIIGYSKEEMIGKNLFKVNLLPASEIPKAVKSLAENVAGKETRDEEYTVIRKDGKHVKVKITALPVEVRGKTLILGVMHQI